MGAEAFTQRATRELLATGETARKRTDETRGDLTPHEARIARMARDGASNQDIATQLFVSRKTVETHVRSILAKLDLQADAGENRRVHAVLAFLQARGAVS